MHYDLDNPDEELLRMIFTDKLFRLNHLYYIRNKSGKIVRFILNDAQTTFITKRKNRNLWLKARQRGITTAAVINRLDDCLFNDHFEAGIIADDLDNAGKIFEKAKVAFERLPEWLKKHRIPTTDKVGEYRFPNGSVFSVDTSFRGGTLSALHVSEMGKISKKYPEKAKEIVTGAFEAVPIDGEIDVESTAEGMSGEFYKLCDQAMGKDHDKISSLEFAFHFEPWWTSDEYKIDVPVEFTQELIEYFDYLEKEQGILLTKEQKAWYALKRQTLKGEMHQEYPSYPEEAFLASGRPVFNQQKISASIKRARETKPTIKKFIIKDMENNEHVVEVKIFKEPKKGMAYSVGGDPAEGLEEGDNSALSVLSRDYEQVAAYAGKLDTDLFGALLVEVSKYFNNARLAWEQNNHGHAVENAIKLRKYFNLYKREGKEEPGKEIKERIGWLNTVKSKQEMLDALKESYRDGSLEINDEETLREMLKCVIEENGNVIVNGKDRVVCLGISIVAISQAGLSGELKAVVPTATKTKDVVKMTVDEKIKYYKRMQRV